MQLMSDIKYTQEEAARIYNIVDRIRICTCGSSNAGWEIVLEVLEEAVAHSHDSLTKDKADPKGFYRDRYFEFAAKVCDSWGLLDHGTGIGWAWPTEDGELFLRFLHDFGTDDTFEEGKWPEWAYEEGSDIYDSWTSKENKEEIQ
jgi:hypothetical protein